MRIIGLLLVATGLILMVSGLRADSAPFDQFSGMAAGRYGDAATWYVIGGFLALVAGALLAAFGPRRL
jgi:hypothetical protein